MKSKKKSKLAFVLFTGLLIILTVVFLSEWYLIRKVSSLTNNQITIGSINYTPPLSLTLRKVAISYQRFPQILLRSLSIRRVFAKQAFAFSSPGTITIQDGQRDVHIRGSVSGNYKEGTIDIQKTYITIEDLGDFEVKGALEQWGKEGITLVIALNGTEIEQVKEMFGLNLPFSGRATGTLSFDYSKKEERNLLRFDIDVKELIADGNKLNAHISGAHNTKEGRTDIKEGRLLNSSGGRIDFNGFIDKENFTLNFNTQNMPLEDLLNLIPEDIRTKYNISVNGGSASLKDFRIESLKKNPFERRPAYSC